MPSNLIQPQETVNAAMPPPSDPMLSDHAATWKAASDLVGVAGDVRKQGLESDFSYELSSSLESEMKTQSKLDESIYQNNAEFMDTINNPTLPPEAKARAMQEFYAKDRALSAAARQTGRDYTIQRQALIKNYVSNYPQYTDDFHKILSVNDAAMKMKVESQYAEKDPMEAMRHNVSEATKLGIPLALYLNTLELKGRLESANTSAAVKLAAGTANKNDLYDLIGSKKMAMMGVLDTVYRRYAPAIAVGSPQAVQNAKQEISQLIADFRNGVEQDRVLFEKVNGFTYNFSEYNSVVENHISDLKTFMNNLNSSDARDAAEASMKMYEHNNQMEFDAAIRAFMPYEPLLVGRQIMAKEAVEVRTNMYRFQSFMKDAVKKGGVFTQMMQGAERGDPDMTRQLLTFNHMSQGLMKIAAGRKDFTPEEKTVLMTVINNLAMNIPPTETESRALDVVLYKLYSEKLRDPSTPPEVLGKTREAFSQHGINHFGTNWRMKTDQTADLMKEAKKTSPDVLVAALDKKWTSVGAQMRDVFSNDDLASALAERVTIDADGTLIFVSPIAKRSTTIGVMNSPFGAGNVRGKNVGDETVTKYWELESFINEYNGTLTFSNSINLPDQSKVDFIETFKMNLQALKDKEENKKKPAKKTVVVTPEQLK